MNGVDYFVGNICIFAGGYAPQGWMQCQGQVLPIRQYQVLYAVIGNRFGGDGINNFNLPNLTGTRVIQAGQGENLLNYNFGQAGGNAVTSLTTANLPAHTHGSPTLATYRGPFASNSLGNSDSPVGAVPAAIPNTSVYSSVADAKMGETDLLSPGPASGSGQPVASMSPYLALNYIIAVVGIYPSRS